MPNYGPALVVTAWKVAQVRALYPFSSSIATTACYARAVRMHGWRMHTAHWALEKRSVSSPCWRSHFVGSTAFAPLVQVPKGWIFVHKLIPFVNDVSTKREVVVLINVLFSSENGKNKVIAKRECKHSRTKKSLQKMPIVALAFHVMPRQRLYSEILAIATENAYRRLGITWNA